MAGGREGSEIGPGLVTARRVSLGEWLGLDALLHLLGDEK